MSTPIVPKNEEQQAGMHIDSFPAEMRGMLMEIDDDGSGYLDVDELTEVFTMYTEMKKAAVDGSIAIAALPKEIQPTLRVFDVDGDGSVAPLELARAAELYKQSRDQVKRLGKAVVVLTIILLALVGTIVGLTAVVVEESKESKVSSTGVTTVKGSDTPVATGSARSAASIYNALDFNLASLELVNQLNFDNSAGLLTYKIVGSYKKTGTPDEAFVKFYSSTGAIITVTSTGLEVVDTLTGLTFTETPEETATRRRLLSHEHGSLFMDALATMPGNNYTVPY